MLSADISESSVLQGLNVSNYVVAAAENLLLLPVETSDDLGGVPFPRRDPTITSRNLSAVPRFGRIAAAASYLSRR